MFQRPNEPTFVSRYYVTPKCQCSTDVAHDLGRLPNACRKPRDRFARQLSRSAARSHGEAACAGRPPPARAGQRGGGGRDEGSAPVQGGALHRFDLGFGVTGLSVVHAERGRSLVLGQGALRRHELAPRLTRSSLADKALWLPDDGPLAPNTNLSAARVEDPRRHTPKATKRASLLAPCCWIAIIHGGHLGDVFALLAKGKHQSVAVL